MKLLLRATVLDVELVLHVFPLFSDTMPPSRLLFRAIPSDQFKATLVLASIAALPVLVVPHSRLFASSFVGGPVGYLTGASLRSDETCLDVMMSNSEAHHNKFVLYKSSIERS